MGTTADKPALVLDMIATSFRCFLPSFQLPVILPNSVGPLGSAGMCRMVPDFPPAVCCSATATAPFCKYFKAVATSRAPNSRQEKQTRE